MFGEEKSSDNQDSETSEEGENESVKDVKTISDNDNEQDSLFLKVFQLFAALTLLAILIGLILVCRKYVLPKCCSIIQKLVSIISNKLMFNSILRAIMQTFLATSIAMWISLQQTDVSTTQGVTDLLIALAILCFTIVAPYLSLKLLRKKFERLREPTFKARFDSLYQNLDYYKPKALPQTSLFLIRRLLFALVIVFLGGSIVLQILVADALSTLLLAFYLSVWPMVGLIHNAIQIVNEIVVLVALWLMFHFTMFIEDPQMRYNLGWRFLYFIGADVALNILFLFYFVGGKIYFAIRAKLMARKARKMAQMRIK